MGASNALGKTGRILRVVALLALIPGVIRVVVLGGSSVSIARDLSVAAGLLGVAGVGVLAGLSTSSLLHRQGLSPRWSWTDPATTRGSLVGAGLGVVVGAVLLLLVVPVTINSAMFGSPSGDTGPVFCGTFWWRGGSVCQGCCESIGVYAERVRFTAIVAAAGAGFVAVGAGCSRGRSSRQFR